MDQIKDQENWDSYFILGTDVLKNKLNISNNELLKEKEKEIVLNKLAMLYLEPIKGNFDISHLLSIHNFIFSSIYPFAGCIRTCTLQKDSHVFCNPNEIEMYLKQELESLNNDFNKDIYSKEEFAFKLANHYYNIMYIHPFRDGNGRAIRTFFRDFVVEKSKNKTCGNLDLDYTKIDSLKLMLGTSSRYIYPGYIENEFINGLVNKKLEKSIKY